MPRVVHCTMRGARWLKAQRSRRSTTAPETLEDPQLPGRASQQCEVAGAHRTAEAVVDAVRVRVVERRPFRVHENGPALEADRAVLLDPELVDDDVAQPSPCGSMSAGCARWISPFASGCGRLVGEADLPNHRPARRVFSELVTACGGRAGSALRTGMATRVSRASGRPWVAGRGFGSGLVRPRLGLSFLRPRS